MSEREQLYWVWAEMRQRCFNEDHKQFADYGGRGITVCDRWESAENFIKDMGPRPKGLTLDRVDNEGNYGPNNCKWSTRKEQNSNRRNCIYVNCDEEMVTLKEYCRRKGLKYRPIVKRIKDRNWPVEVALSVPLGAFHRLPKDMKRG